MGAVGLLVAVPVTILVSGEEDSPPPDALAPIEVTEPELGPLRIERSFGVEARLPKGWTRDRTHDVLELTSANGAARVAISAPGPAADAEQLHSEVLNGLRSSYRDFDVLRNIDKAPIGELKGRATAVSARLPKAKGGDEARILVSTASGKERAHVVALFTIGEPGPAVLEAQALINKLRFLR